MKELTMFGKKITVKEIMIFTITLFVVWGSLFVNYYYKQKSFSTAVIFLICLLSIYFLAHRTLSQRNINKNLVIVFSACLAVYLALTWLTSKNWLITDIIAIILLVYAFKILPKISLKTALIICSSVVVCDLLAVYFSNFMVNLANIALADNFPILLNIPGSISLANTKFVAIIGWGDLFWPGLITKAAFEIRKTPGLRMLPIVTLVSHAFGIASTFWVCEIFNHTQPAMVFIVPSMLIAITLFYFNKGLLFKKITV